MEIICTCVDVRIVTCCEPGNNDVHADVPGTVYPGPKGPGYFIGYVNNG
ncbi:hypothetical protein SuNHUV7_04330 (plasmid) [Pseudoseohaeicola sp. NH-UV-7]